MACLVCSKCGSSDVVDLKYSKCRDLRCRKCGKITKLKSVTLEGSIKSLPEYCFKSRMIKNNVPVRWYCLKRDRFQFRHTGFVYDTYFGWKCVCGEWVIDEDPNHAVIEYGLRWVLPHA